MLLGKTRYASIDHHPDRLRRPVLYPTERRARGEAAPSVAGDGGAADRGDRPLRGDSVDQYANRISATTVRLMMSPNTCCWMSWFVRLVPFTSVVIFPPFHFTPKLPFSMAYARSEEHTSEL